MQSINDQISDLLVYSETLPKDSHRYLWCEERIKNLQYIKNNCVVRSNRVVDKIPNRSIKVCFKGVIYNSIEDASIHLNIDYQTLLRDINTERFFFGVYKVKNYYK